MPRTRYRARWLAPIASPPLDDGWVDVDGGVIRAVGAAADAGSDAPDREVDLGSVCVLPGLVNAHTHLELSGQRSGVPPARSMPAWAAALMRNLQGEPPGAEKEAIVAAVAELRRAGTALVGDVTNTLASLAALEAGPVEAVVFHELLGFDVAGAAAAAAAERLDRLVSERGDERGAGPPRGACALLGFSRALPGAGRGSRAAFGALGRVARRVRVPARGDRGLAGDSGRPRPVGSGMAAAGIRAGGLPGRAGLASG